MYKDSTSYFHFTVDSMFKNKGKLYNLQLIVSFKPRKAIPLIHPRLLGYISIHTIQNYSLTEVLLMPIVMVLACGISTVPGYIRAS